MDSIPVHRCFVTDGFAKDFAELDPLSQAAAIRGMRFIAGVFGSDSLSSFFSSLKGLRGTSTHGDWYNEVLYHTLRNGDAIMFTRRRGNDGGTEIVILSFSDNPQSKPKLNRTVRGDTTIKDRLDNLSFNAATPLPEWTKQVLVDARGDALKALQYLTSFCSATAEEALTYPSDQQVNLNETTTWSRKVTSQIQREGYDEWQDRIRREGLHASLEVAVQSIEKIRAAHDITLLPTGFRNIAVLIESAQILHGVQQGGYDNDEIRNALSDAWKGADDLLKGLKDLRKVNRGERGGLIVSPDRINAEIVSAVVSGKYGPPPKPPTVATQKPAPTDSRMVGETVIKQETTGFNRIKARFIQIFKFLFSPEPEITLNPELVDTALSNSREFDRLVSRNPEVRRYYHDITNDYRLAREVFGIFINIVERGYYQDYAEDGTLYERSQYAPGYEPITLGKVSREIRIIMKNFEVARGLPFPGDSAEDWAAIYQYCGDCGDKLAEQGENEGAMRLYSLAEDIKELEARIDLKYSFLFKVMGGEYEKIKKEDAISAERRERRSEEINARAAIAEAHHRNSLRDWQEASETYRRNVETALHAIAQLGADALKLTVRMLPEEPAKAKFTGDKHYRILCDNTVPGTTRSGIAIS